MPGPLKLAVEELGNVIEKLPPGRRVFAQSLCSQFWSKGLTENQAPWVEKLIEIARAPKEPEARPTVEVGEMSGVIALFDKAQQHLKQPKIVLALEGGQEFRLSIAGQRAFSPGSINVTDLAPYGSNKWFGRVYRDGRFEPSPREELPAGLVELLKQFADDPATIATQFGRLTGRCCFCGSGLTDERSTKVGFGPVCAANWGLKPQ